MSIRRRRVAEWGLVLLGTLNLIGFVSDQTWLRGLAVASVASPLPLVFSQFRGFETFAAGFSVKASYADGEIRLVEITPGLYARLGGSYNRRNTYGAVVSYGPRFETPGERALLTHVLGYGFCGQGPLAQQLGRPNPASVELEVRSLTAGSAEVWNQAISCGVPND